MNKKLLSVVIGAALAGSMSLAQADVSLYGQIDASIDSVDYDSATDDINMNSNYSSLGVRGFEDLGNGVKAIFQAEFQYDMTEGNNFGGDGSTAAIIDPDTDEVLFPSIDYGMSRDQWVGVEGAFGTVRAGTVFTPYHDHGAMIDPLYRTSLEGRADVGGLIDVFNGTLSSLGGGLQSTLNSDVATDTAVTGLQTNTLRYDSPDMNGLSASAFYTFDNSEFDGEDNDPYGVGAQYKNGNILGFADYVTSDNGGDDDAWKVGGSYTMGNIGLYGQYEDGGLIALGLVDANIWHVGGSFTMGNTMLYAGFGQAEFDDQDGWDAWTLGAMHSLSQRTKLYAGFNQIDVDEAGELDHFALGLRHSF